MIGKGFCQEQTLGSKNTFWRRNFQIRIYSDFGRDVLGDAMGPRVNFDESKKIMLKEILRNFNVIVKIKG